MEFVDLAPHVKTLLDALEAALRKHELAWWDAPYGVGKWQRRQLAGHLIDSAANNHQRFVRAALTPRGGTYAGPGYDQEGCVRVQHFDTFPIHELAALMVKYNRLIAHIFANYPATNFQTPCKIGEYPATTIERVALSYVAHLEHHLRQLVGDGLPYSGLPWPFDE